MKTLIISLVLMSFCVVVFAETQENYLATLEALEEALQRCDTISIDEDLYNAFLEQMTTVDNCIDSLTEPTIDDDNELALFVSIINCRNSLASAGYSSVSIHWYNALYWYDKVDQQKIDYYLKAAETERSKSTAQLDAAWDSYEKIEFGSNNDVGGDENGDDNKKGGGGSEGIGCFIEAILSE